MPQAHVATQMGLSRGTVAKWWRLWCEHGEAGLVDRSSRPHRSPGRTPARVEERICRLRRSTRRGPVYLGARTGVPVATVWRILQRNGLNRLSWIDRPTGQVIRRHERNSPGELVHLDINEVGKIPQAAAGGSMTAAAPGPNAPAAAAWATPIFMSLSTTTAVSPTSKPTMMRPPTHWWGSGGEPRTGSGPTTWRSEQEREAERDGQGTGTVTVSAPLRSTLPGSASVASPSSTVVTPLTNTCLIPVASE